MINYIYFLNNKSKIYLVFILVNMTFNVHSQVTQQWVARYNGIGNSYDFAAAIAVDISGNIIVTGESRSTGLQGSEDYATVKYNAAGVQQWSARYNGTGNGIDMPTAIVTDKFKNIYITGWSTGNGTLYDYATIKYDSSGVLLWTAVYNGTANLDDGANALAIDTAGNVYVTGFSYGAGTNYDYLTIKYNNNGVQQWISRYNGEANIDDFANSIETDAAGNIYVTGYSRGISTGYDFVTIKYNTNGITQWISRYNGPVNGDDYANSLKVDLSGNVYVCGYSPGSGSGNDYLLVKYNSTGVQQWTARYNGTGNGDDFSLALAVDISGNSFVTGNSTGIASGFDYVTVKYNSAGVQQWLQRYNGPGNADDYGIGIIPDNNGGCYVTGYSSGIGSNFDYALIKYSPGGIEQWVQRYNGPANNADISNAIAVDSSLNIYITGGSEGIGSGSDFATIKYSQVTEIKPDNNYISKEFSLKQNYPNPFNPSTKIRFEIPGSSVAQTFLSVYNALGQQIAILVHVQLKPGTYEVDFNATDYQSGVYFYKLISGGYIETKKMVLIK